MSLLIGGNGGRGACRHNPVNCNGDIRAHPGAVPATGTQRLRRNLDDMVATVVERLRRGQHLAGAERDTQAAPLASLAVNPDTKLHTRIVYDPPLGVVETEFALTPESSCLPQQLHSPLRFPGAKTT